MAPSESCRCAVEVLQPAVSFVGHAPLPHLEIFSNGIRPSRGMNHSSLFDQRIRTHLSTSHAHKRNAILRRQIQFHVPSVTAQLDSARCAAVSRSKREVQRMGSLSRITSVLVVKCVISMSVCRPAICIKIEQHYRKLSQRTCTNLCDSIQRKALKAKNKSQSVIVILTVAS